MKTEENNNEASESFDEEAIQQEEESPAETPRDRKVDWELMGSPFW